SPLSYPGTQEQYAVYLHALVRNLFNEGNDVYRERDWNNSISQYTEALNIADYAKSEEILIPKEIIEKLYINRIACYSNMGCHDKVLEDCNIVLSLNASNCKALYRKSKALSDLGRYRKAYDAVAKCSLAVPQALNYSVEDIEPDLLTPRQEAVPVVSLPASNFSHEVGSELASVPVMPLTSVLPLQVEGSALPSSAVLANGGKMPFTMPEAFLDDGDMVLGDELDDLLDSAPETNETVMPSALVRGPLQTASVSPSIPFSASLLGTLPIGARGKQTLEPSLGVNIEQESFSALGWENSVGGHSQIKNVEDKSWKKIRPRPTKTNYEGPYYICKDVAAEEECRYSGHCTFAYCQEEIDVWTLERKGAFSREAFFGGNGKINLTVFKLLQEHLGEFIFLCEKCFDHKPRMISKRNKDNSTACSHPVTKHEFEDNKCLVHILRETTVKYSKIRSFHGQCQLDLCRHEVRYGCLREDECFYAHSLVELKVWIMQNETGISHDAIAQESKRYWQNLEANVPGAQIKFVCAQCLRNGQVIEPDKNRKYCSAKARHSWTKDRRAMRVMSIERKKWMNIHSVVRCKDSGFKACPKRPGQVIQPQFAHLKQTELPLDALQTLSHLCNHIASGKKCQYVGNCSFAHSPEEREVWTYMKENGISSEEYISSKSPKPLQDMEQFYELWLKSQKNEKSEDVASQSNKENGKQIHMPTDYAEVTVDFHCWMCGKNCNSEKQWQGHISSEKHKEKVFHTEDDQYCWQHRFPTGYFSICDRYMNGTCPEGSSCKFAHGNAELHEWEERRDALKMKLNKARKDHLIAPNDNDFGKYMLPPYWGFREINHRQQKYFGPYKTCTKSDVLGSVGQILFQQPTLVETLNEDTGTYLSSAPSYRKTGEETTWVI
ncbi:Zinc finger CCCH domain-containing protein 7A, partial [Saguinus oedipus]